MALLQKLRDQGWYLTEDGLNRLTSDLQSEDVKKIIAAALDWDMKDIGGDALPTKPETNGHIPGKIVLQLQKMRNISAPKANEESTAAPRLLQLELSDGQNSIVALELQRIPNLNLNVPPGTKLYFKSDKLQILHGFLVLKEAEVQVLGGCVEPLVEKWEVARQTLKYAKSNRRLSGVGAPPPWIAFGKRLDAHKEALQLDRNFKSLQMATDKDKNTKENDEFNASRTQAIAEAAKAGQKKVFGGGQQNILDHNVKKILERGFTEDEAKLALKTTNNNLERALYNLKRRNKTIEADVKSFVAPVSAAAPRGRGSASVKEEASASKPQTNVSLFDFLNDKLPATVSPSPTTTTSTITQTPAQSTFSSSQTNSKSTKEIRNPFRTNPGNANSERAKFENNMSSSFAANRTSNGRSGDRTPRPSQTPKQVQTQRTSYSQREDRRNNLPKSGNKTAERSRSENGKQPQSTSSSAAVAPPDGTNLSAMNGNGNYSVTSSNSNRRNERGDKHSRKERSQTPRQSISTTGCGSYQGNKRSTDTRANDTKSNQVRENHGKYNNEAKNPITNYQQPPPTKSQNTQNSIEELVDSTANLSLQNKKEYSTQGKNRNTGGGNSRPSNQNQSAQQLKSNNNSKNQSPTGQFISSQNFTNKSQASSQHITPANHQQPSASHTFVPQLPNGFSYDPSKIIGFQSKEANEYAMNLLKSQGLLPQQSSPGPVAPNPMQSSQQQMIASVQTAPPAAVAYMPGGANVFMAPQQAPVAQFGIMPGGGWLWNIGDLCLAKYWEDGNYYDAKITAVAENTCVVLFLGYGNHEEVLKSDCLPVSDPQQHPLNVFQAGPPPAGIQQQPLPQAYPGSSHVSSGGGGAGGSHRYRTERQMYVPPAKRGNQNNN